MKIILLLILSVISYTLTAQKYELQGEGKNSSIKMYWTVDKWPANLKGFEIKRKLNKGEWQIFTGKIYPAISLSDDLSNRVKDNNVRLALLSQGIAVMKENDLSIMTNAQMLTFVKNEAGLKAVNERLKKDIKVAVIAGFGAVDGPLLTGKTYEYGLFPIDGVIRSEPVASYFYEIGGSFESGFIVEKGHKVSPTSLELNDEHFSFTGEVYIFDNSFSQNCEDLFGCKNNSGRKENGFYKKTYGIEIDDSRKKVKIAHYYFGNNDSEIYTGGYRMNITKFYEISNRILVIVCSPIGQPEKRFEETIRIDKLTNKAIKYYTDMYLTKFSRSGRILYSNN